MKCSQCTTLRLWMHFSSGSQQRKVSFLNRSVVFVASSLPYILLISALSERIINSIHFIVLLLNVEGLSLYVNLVHFLDILI